MVCTNVVLLLSALVFPGQQSFLMLTSVFLLAVPFLSGMILTRITLSPIHPSRTADTAVTNTTNMTPVQRADAMETVTTGACLGRPCLDS